MYHNIEQKLWRFRKRNRNICKNIKYSRFLLARQAFYCRFELSVNMKKMKDHSLLRLLDHDSRPSSSRSLFSLSGFSIYGLLFLMLVSSCRASTRKFTYSCESCYSSPLNCSLSLPRMYLNPLETTTWLLFQSCWTSDPKTVTSSPLCPMTLSTLFYL